MSRDTIFLHSPLSPAEFEARFHERVDEDDWWAHGPLVWFSGKSVLGQIDGDTFTLRRPATLSRSRVPLLLFHGRLSSDANGGTRVEGYFALHPLPVLIARVLGIGAGVFFIVEVLGEWNELRDGITPVTDRLPEIVMPLALIAYGIFAPAISRLFAEGTETFLLDFLRKNLLAQSDASTDVPILDSALR